MTSWSVLQSDIGHTNFTTSVAATYGSNLSSGTKLIAYVGYNNTGDGFTNGISDGNGNNFTKILDSGLPSGNYGGLQIWVLDTPAGDVGTKPTITATFDSPSDFVLLVQEVSGLQSGIYCIDGVAGMNANYVSSGGITTGDVTYASSASGQYLVSALNVISNGGTNMTLTAPSGYTLDSSSITGTDPGVAIGVAYKSSTGGSETGNGWSASSAGGSYEGWGQIVAAFRPASYSDVELVGAEVFSNGSTGSSYTATVPAGVQAGNLVLVYGVCAGGGGVTALSASTTGTALHAADPSHSTGQSTQAGGGWDNVWYFTAGAGDPGSAQITITPSQTTYLAIAMAWYTATAGIDVITQQASGSTETTYTDPTVSSVTAGDWGVVFNTYIGGGDPQVTSSYAIRATSPDFYVAAGDTGASVGSAGSTIGGGTWTDTNASYWASWIIGLKPSSSGTPANVTGVAAAVTAAGGVGTPAGSANVTGVAALVTAAGGVGVPSGAANTAGVAAQVVAAGGVGTPSGSASVTGVAAVVTVAGGIGTPSGGASGNVAGVAASVTAAGGVGAPSGGVNLSGAAAAVTAAGGIGTPAGAANVAGAAASVPAAGGVGVPSGAANVTGVAASVTAASGIGTLAAAVNVIGTAALVTVAGGIGAPSTVTNVVGVAAAVTAAGGTGIPSGAANVVGVAAQVVAAGGIGNPVRTQIAVATVTISLAAEAEGTVRPAVVAAVSTELAAEAEGTVRPAVVAAVSTELAATATIVNAI